MCTGCGEVYIFLQGLCDDCVRKEGAKFTRLVYAGRLLFLGTHSADGAVSPALDFAMQHPVNVRTHGMAGRSFSANPFGIKPSGGTQPDDKNDAEVRD